MAIKAEEFMKIASNEQKKLLFDLVDLAETEKKLADKLNAMRSSRDGIVSTDGFSITICENDDDLIVVAQKEIRELADVRENIAVLLKKAVNDMGMGDVGIIQRQYKNYVK